PTVFYQQAPLQGYLEAALTQGFLLQGADTATAKAKAKAGAGLLAPQIAGIPLGTITPEEGAPDQSAIILAYRNYGEVVLYGYDIGLQVGIANGLSLNGSLSYVDKNYFANLDNVADLALNAPKFKFSLGG